ncbi:MAG: DUF6265 family protein [Acidobacteriota bacterium]|nr:DUF6265 family protein [Acidobacteriota bacterium]
MQELSKFVLVLIAVALLTPTPGSAQQKTTLDDLAWLAGCWQDERGTRFREESWTKPKGGTMLGVGRQVRDGKTTEYEFMRIHEDKGEIYFTAKPSGQAETTFKLVSYADGKATFENPQHDFPTRVIYSKQSDGSLLARIEGVMNGQKRGIDFPFKRAKCE